jgi:hypothetical protein
MAVWAEVLGDGTISGEEPLSLAGCVEPLQAWLSRAGGVVRVLCPVIEIAVRARFDSRENLSLSRSVALQLVSNDHARPVRQTLEEFREELLRGLLVPPPLAHDIEYVPGLLPRSPQIVRRALARQKHLLQVPLVTWPGTAAPELSGGLLPALAPPFADGLVGDNPPAFHQQRFAIPEAQAEAKVQPYRVTQDLHRKPVILRCGGGGWCVQAVTLTHGVGASQVDNALVVHQLFDLYAGLL